MPESPSARTDAAPLGPLVYRPLSGLAFASLVIAGCYAALITILALASWLWRMPLFLGSWPLLFPALAAGLALAARRHIRRSEGTRSGETLAAWGLWLSVLFGFGYAAFYLATFLAVKWQAEAHIEKLFLDPLRAGKVLDAFYFTLEPDKRQTTKAGDVVTMYSSVAGGSRGPLVSFQNSELVRIFEQGGERAAVQDLGVKTWDFDKGGYRVVKKYRVTTPEGTFDMQLAVQSNDSEPQRRWQLLWFGGDTGISPQASTPLGETIKSWRAQSSAFVMQWLKRRQQGDRVGVYLATLEPRERGRLADRLAGVIAFEIAALGGRPSALLADLPPMLDPVPTISPDLLPGYGELGEGSLVHADKLEAAAMKSRIIADAKNLFGSGSSALLNLTETPGRPEPAGPADRLRMTYHLDLFPAFVGEKKRSSYRCDVKLILESDPGPIAPERRPSWRVLSLELLRGTEVSNETPEMRPPN